MKKVYFISDAHLGSLLDKDPRSHEQKVVAWLDSVKADAKAIYMLGDMFDFWFEYRTVVPKGFVRFLGKTAELIDAGIDIYFFTGNHDLWTFGYLENEVGLTIYKTPQSIRLGNKLFYMAHGDGLSVKKDFAFKCLRKIFHSRFCQEAFRLLPPLIGQKVGFKWSKSSRLKHKDIKFKGEDKESLIIYGKDYFEKHPETDFILFGHRHIELDLQIKNKKRIVILGDFIHLFTYGVFDGENFWLESFE